MLMFVLEANRMFLKLIVNKWVLVLEHCVVYLVSVTLEVDISSGVHYVFTTGD